jgi:hypothetical protein
MTEIEINQLAKETCDLGLHMSMVFTKQPYDKDFMVLAIAACITQVSSGKKPETYSTMPMCDFDGEYFKKLRVTSGLTLRQTEDATGISNSYLSQFENGKIRKPSHHVITTLLNWYNGGIAITKNEFEIGSIPTTTP